MVYVFYGEDTVASRRALIDLRKSYNPDSIIEFTGMLMDDFVRIADGQDFFSESKLVVVEANKYSDIKDVSFIEYLPKKPDSTHVVLWVGGEIPVSSLILKFSKQFNWKLRYFDKFNRSYVFDFLDSLFSRNQDLSYRNFSYVLKNSDENMFGIITLISSRIRLLLWSKLNCESIATSKPFLKTKASSQARLFSTPELTTLFDYCCSIDLGSKTGQIDPVFGILGIIGKV